MTGLIDLGGVPYLLPLVDRTRIYDMETVIPKCIGAKDFPQGWYVSGACAGPWPSQGVNCEVIHSLNLGFDVIRNLHLFHIVIWYLDGDEYENWT